MNASEPVKLPSIGPVVCDQTTISASGPGNSPFRWTSGPWPGHCICQWTRTLPLFQWSVTRPLYLLMDQRNLPSIVPVVHDQTTVSGSGPENSPFCWSSGPVVHDQTTVPASRPVELHSTGLMICDQTCICQRTSRTPFHWSDGPWPDHCICQKTSRNLPFTGLVVHDHKDCQWMSWTLPSSGLLDQ